MSVPSISTSSSTTQPPILVGDTGKSVLPAARVMTLPSVSSTSTRQYSDETLMTAEALLAISERPSTSLSQFVDTPDPEVILPGELRTVATRLCDPLAITLPLHHSTPLEPPSSHETPTRFLPSKFHLFSTSLQVHQFYHLRYHSHSLHFPVYRKLSQIATNNTVQPQPKFSHTFSLAYIEAFITVDGYLTM